MRRIFVCLVVLQFFGCGGSDSSLFPLWIPTDVVVTDIDGDGRGDLLTIAQLSTSMSHREGRLTVRRGRGFGAFESPDSYTFGTYPWKLAVGDIDGDALPDLIVADVDGLAAWMFLQDAANRGRFLPPQKVAGDVAAYQAAIADLDGDGAPDLAVGDARPGTARVLLLYQNPAQRGSFFPPVDLAMPGESLALATGDLNGDGRNDLLAWVALPPSGFTPNRTLVLALQQGAGGLGAVTTLTSETGLTPEMVAIADYDGDGLEDIFTFLTPSGTDYRAKIGVLLQGAEPGTFSPVVDTSLAEIRGIDGAAVADLDGDGRPDVAVTGFFPVGSPSSVKSRLNIFRQAGGGAFVLSAVYDVPISASRVAAGDLNGDGLNDLVLLGDANRCVVLIQSRDARGTFGVPQFLP
jgi:hypothetical protein